MTLGEALQAARTRIDALDARVLLQHVTGFGHAQVAAYPERMLDAAQDSALAALVERRAAGEPVAYLVGWREFYGRRFGVTPAVLIPRPETELIVELALARMRACTAPRVLDLGCGSGILAITLALELPQARVSGVDASAAALAVAGANAAALGVCVELVESDWYADVVEDGFDLIVANPPYVAPGDPHLAQGDVRFEPRSALVGGGPAGLSDLQAIIDGARTRLRPGGWLLVEHGWEQGEATRAQFAAAGFGAIETARDLAGNERVSLGQAPTSADAPTS